MYYCSSIEIIHYLITYKVMNIIILVVQMCQMHIIVQEKII